MRAGHEGEGHHGDAERGPEAEAGTSQLSRWASVRLGSPASLAPIAEEHGDDHDVVEHRRAGRGEEPVAGVEEGRAEGHEPVEEDLREQEAGSDVPTSRSAATSTDESGCSVSSADDQGRGEHGDAVMTASTIGRHREHRVGGLVVACPRAGR